LDRFIVIAGTWVVIFAVESNMDRVERFFKIMGSQPDLHETAFGKRFSNSTDTQGDPVVKGHAVDITAVAQNILDGFPLLGQERFLRDIFVGINGFVPS